MKRVVEPELLDELPANDPLAWYARNDLQRLNAWMGNAGILARQLRGMAPGAKPWRILDLGAGDGRFMWQVASRLPQGWKGTVVGLLDKRATLSPQARHGLENLGWDVRCLCAEVTEWLRNAPTESWSVICANLFLHHFPQQELQQLLKLISERARTFIAVEPRRSLWGLMASKMVGLIGCNHITRHDAVVSVHAGFTGKALSDLWPINGGWHLEERAAGPFSHLFVASKMVAESALAERVSLSPLTLRQTAGAASLSLEGTHRSTGLS
jgi:SAM-dependent methyltransferase